jgi:hypothetical protein
MTTLKIENPDLAGTGAGTEAGTRSSSTARTALQTAQHRGPSLLITLASWLVRIEHRRLERKIPAGWDTALSLQLDRLTDIREWLAEYLRSERRRP